MRRENNSGRRDSGSSREGGYNSRFGDSNRSSGSRSGGSNRSGGFNRSGGSNRSFNNQPREMHKTICAGCNTECEVPFKPSGERPVYCRDCFAKNKPAPRY